MDRKKKKVLILLIVCLVIIFIYIMYNSSTKNKDTDNKKEDLSKSKILSTLPDPSSPKYQYEIEKLLATMATGLLAEFVARAMTTPIIAVVIHVVASFRSAKALSELGKEIGSVRLGTIIRSARNWASNKYLQIKQFRGLETPAEKASREATEKAVKEVVQKGFAKVLTTTGKVFNPIFLAFDVISLTLDLTDAGGYGKLNYKKTYLEQHKAMINNMRATLKELGVDYPIIAGPLTKLYDQSEKQYEALLNKEVQKILPKYMEPVQKAIFTDLLSKKITPKDLEKNDVFNEYLKKYLNGNYAFQIMAEVHPFQSRK